MTSLSEAVTSSSTVSWLVVLAVTRVTVPPMLTIRPTRALAFTAPPSNGTVLVLVTLAPLTSRVRLSLARSAPENTLARLDWTKRTP